MQCHSRARASSLRSPTVSVKLVILVVLVAIFDSVSCNISGIGSDIGGIGLNIIIGGFHVVNR